MEATLFCADFETPRCQFCTKLRELSDLCYLGKNSITAIKIEIEQLNAAYY